MPSKRPADSGSDPETAAIPAAPTVRRISNPRPKKSPAKPANEPSPDRPESVEPVTVSEPSPAESNDDSRSMDSDWPAPETSGAPSQEGGKRKRRRRKGKGGQGGQANQSTQAADAPAEAGEPSAPSETGGQAPRPQHPPRPPQPPRPKVDPELLAHRAWKIYLSEVSEEGVALINDHDARELSRRCFRLAEIFLEEQSRRI